jgi:hypothetical protein
MKIIISALVMLWALSTSALAHELESSRATLVLRDQTHLSITFFVDYLSVVHQVLAPQRSAQDFVLMYSAMKPQEFQAQLADVQRKLASSTSLLLASGKPAVLSRWVWPEAIAVQSLLQQRAMQAVVAPGEHTHTVQMEIRTEAKLGGARDFSAVTLQLPPQFQQVLVVSYQPKQVWVKPGLPSPVIRF